MAHADAFLEIKMIHKMSFFGAPEECNRNIVESFIRFKVLVHCSRLVEADDALLDCNELLLARSIDVTNIVTVARS